MASKRQKTVSYLLYSPGKFLCRSTRRQTLSREERGGGVGSPGRNVRQGGPWREEACQRASCIGDPQANLRSILDQFLDLRKLPGAEMS